MKFISRISILGTFLLYAFAGIMHFIYPQVYLKIMPPGIPYPLELVYISGALECAGACGVLFLPTRKVAAWGVFLLLVAVFPANIYQALTPELHDGISWFWWFRLPLQVPMLYWAYRVSRIRGNLITR